MLLLVMSKPIFTERSKKTYYCHFRSRGGSFRRVMNASRETESNQSGRLFDRTFQTGGTSDDRRLWYRPLKFKQSINCSLNRIIRVDSLVFASSPPCFVVCSSSLRCCCFSAQVWKKFDVFVFVFTPGRFNSPWLGWETSYVFIRLRTFKLKWK